MDKLEEMLGQALDDMVYEEMEMREREKESYNQALEDFERKMAYFCFCLKENRGNLCSVDVVEDELQIVKSQLIK